MLRQGDKGAAVRELVDDLRELDFELDVGEIFNSIVRRSVETFQVGQLDVSGQPLVVDGKVGPNTRWALDCALGRRSVEATIHVDLPLVPAGGSPTGRRALEKAIQEAVAGAGEEGSDNHGPDLRRYYAGHGSEGQSWCAAFASYCFREAVGRDPVFGYLTGAQAIHNRMRKLGHAYPASLSKPPEPGDLFVWRRVDPQNLKKTSWQGHVGIVHGFSDGVLWTIEGNRGPYPSRVKPFRYSWSTLVVSAANDRFKGMYGLSRHP